MTQLHNLWERAKLAKKKMPAPPSITLRSIEATRRNFSGLIDAPSIVKE